MFSDKTVRMNKSNESLTGRDTFSLFKIQQENNTAEEVSRAFFALTHMEDDGSASRLGVSGWVKGGWSEEKWKGRWV